LSAWLEWLRERRFGGDEAVRAEFLANLAKIRDRILDDARLQPGETLVDVGCGDGLIGFGALERGAAEVVFVDIEDALLDACREAAGALGVLERCRFVLARAEDLSPVQDRYADVVAFRSVLIFVDDKDAALDEFHRVLRPGGRLSLFEPINRHYRLGRGFDFRPVRDLADRVFAVFEHLQPRESDPMLNFDEHDLFEWVVRAGFDEVHMEFRLSEQPAEPRPWDVASRLVGNPKIPSLGEAIDEALSPEEAARFVAHLRPLVEEGRGRMREGVVHLWARR
jgi:ubiquinone/menaquinone biosynthesis C-methylase UbiE